MRWLSSILIIFLILLQYRLWVGEGSLAQKVSLERKVEKQLQENVALEERNQILANAVEDLKEGTEGIEERARTELGMVKEGETFYMVVDKQRKEEN